MARTEVRKECPSCGLGVPLDAKVCEFCGWDFEEEDEWISQIEQLEQELMSEKQKTDTARVDKMIRSTLRSPVKEKPPEPAPRTAKPIAITIKKKIPSKPAVAGEAEEGEAVTEPERITVSAPPATAQRKEAISIKVGSQEEELPPPPEELEEKRVPAAKPAISPVPGKKVRRVVKGGKRPPAPPGKPVATGALPVSKPKPATIVTTATTKPDVVSAPPAKPQPPIAAQPTKPKEEKKGLFGGLGKMFSIQKPPATPGKAEGAKQPSARPAPPKKTEQEPSAKKETPSAGKEGTVVTVKVFVCPLCNSEVKETEKVCPKCGAEFE
ncbi:MAG: hypothetical protein QW505_01370 [Thermoplasmata archaeon]